MFKELILSCLLFATTTRAQDLSSYDPECKKLGAYARVKYDTDCHQYVECGPDKKAKEVLTCPSNLAYDENTQSCTWTSDVDGCDSATQGGSQNPAADPCAENDDCKNADATLPIYDSMHDMCVAKGTIVCEEDEYIPQCSKTSKGYTEKFIADKENCAGYYYCDANNKRYKGTCASGYYFDPVKQMCVYQSSLKTCKPVKKSSSSTSDVTSVDWDTVCSGKKNTFIADPRLCNAYIYCNGDGEPRQGFCEEGMYFSNGSCTKTPPSSCTCEPVWKKLIEDDDSKEIAHTDPKKYYLCLQGDRKLEECDGGAVFNKASESCEM